MKDLYSSRNQNSEHINKDSSRRVLNSKPTLKRWSNRSPTVEPRRAQPKTDHTCNGMFHCRSDQLDRPDCPHSPTKLDQLLYTTFARPLLDHTRPPHDHSRLLHDFNSTTTPISTLSSRPLHDHYSTNSNYTRSLLDLYSISTRSDRPGRIGIMGYWSNRGLVDRVLIVFFFFLFRQN